MTARRRWIAGCSSVVLAANFGMSNAGAAQHRGAPAFDRAALRSLPPQAHPLALPLRPLPERDGTRAGERLGPGLPSGSSTPNAPNAPTSLGAPSGPVPPTVPLTKPAATPLPFANPLRRHRMASNGSLPTFGDLSF